MEIIQYTPQLRVVNLEMLAKGRGFPYLLAVKGIGAILVAKQWKRKIPKQLKAREVLIKF